MRNFLFLLLVAFVTLLLLLFITNPGLLDNIWLWLVGFVGGIIGLFRNLFDQIKQFIRRGEEKKLALVSATVKQPETIKSNFNSHKGTAERIDSLIQKIEDQQTVQTGNTPFHGTTLTVLRYLDDSDTTLGLLFIRNKFFAYTLEDTYRKEKIAKETRIPAGEYVLGFLEQSTGLTVKYQNKFEWFTYHLEIKNVPNYSGVYIHIGNDKEDTAGCLLIADGVNASTVQKSIMYSTRAYERLYKRMKELIGAGEKVRIVIHDENWFEKINLQNI